MRPALALLQSAPRRTPGVFGLLVVLYLVGLVAAVWAHKPSLLSLCGVALWFWSMLRGMDLIDLMRPESLLLPGLRRHLATAAATEWALALLPATLVAAGLGGPLAGARTFALLGLAVSVGLTQGAGRGWIRMGVWVILLGVQWLPGALKQVLHDVAFAPQGPILLLVLEALMLAWVLRPLFRVSDTPPPRSPLAVLAARPGENVGLRALGRGGTLRQRFAAVSNRLADQAFQRALARYRQRATRSRMRTLLRTVILPHDGPTMLILQVILVIGVLALYTVLVRDARHWDAAFVGFYAVIIATGRFQRLGMGLPKFRPQLAELYLLTAPATRRDFQTLYADTLLWLVATNVVSSVVYAAAICALLHAADPTRVVTSAGVTGAGAAFTALSAFLVGPETRGKRQMVSLLNMAVFGALYAGVYWLIGMTGPGLGGVLGLVVSLSLGLGAWSAARREFASRPPQFDAPLR